MTDPPTADTGAANDTSVPQFTSVVGVEVFTVDGAAVVIDGDGCTDAMTNVDAVGEGPRARPPALASAIATIAISAATPASTARPRVVSS